jgi:hypothetical protein
LYGSLKKLFSSAPQNFNQSCILSLEIYPESFRRLHQEKAKKVKKKSLKSPKNPKFLYGSLGAHRRF